MRDDTVMDARCGAVASKEDGFRPAVPSTATNARRPTVQRSAVGRQQGVTLMMAGYAIERIT